MTLSLGNSENVEEPSMSMVQKDSTDVASPGSFRENPMIAIGSPTSFCLQDSGCSCTSDATVGGVPREEGGDDSSMDGELVPEPMMFTLEIDQSKNA